MNDIEKEIFKIFKEHSDNSQINYVTGDIASEEFINKNPICIEENLIQALIKNGISEENAKRTISFMVEKGLIKYNYVIYNERPPKPYILYSIKPEDCQETCCKRILILTENGKELL